MSYIYKERTHFDLIPTAGTEAEAKGGEAARTQPVGEFEERAGGPQEDTRTQARGLNLRNQLAVSFSMLEKKKLLLLLLSLRRRREI